MPGCKIASSSLLEPAVAWAANTPLRSPGRAPASWSTTSVAPATARAPVRRWPRGRRRDSRQGGRAVANYDSVATEDGAANIIKTALDEFGAVHGVVSNAGILRDGTFHKMSFENWDAVLKVHLYGGYHVLRAAWPHFREQSYGRVVVATSTSGLFGNFGQTNYGAAKLGLVGLINTLALEGAKYNIHANALAPIAATRMTQDILPPEVLEKLTPEFVAPVVAYLCTEECADNASVYVVGGGKVQRVALFGNDGANFDKPPSVQDVAARWAEITDLSGAKIAGFKL